MHIIVPRLGQAKDRLTAESGIATIMGHADSTFTLKNYIHSTTLGTENAEDVYSKILSSSGQNLVDKNEDAHETLGAAKY